MTVYPFAIDGDAEIIRVDDNITEIGGDAINQLREAVFAIEKELGIRPAGSAGSVATRLDISLNPDGSIKASALTSVGLATLPITNGQVATNAGIDEFKLNLDHTTSDLHALAIANQALIAALTTFANLTSSDLNTHIAGGSLLANGDPARHVASHIDLNAAPSDSRDTTYSWTGLLNKDGVTRSAAHVADALLQINDDLTSHQNATLDAHVATAVSLSVDNFDEIPKTVDNVQKLADHIDRFEELEIGDHRATQHANGIPKIARSQGCDLPDGYKENVIPSTTVNTFLVRSPNISPVDDLSSGDDIIQFVPDNSGFVFDSLFSQVRAGDIVTVNYANGLEASFPIDSLRFVPGSEWVVRINGTNLGDGDGYALARIDRPRFDRDTAGILAVASANATPVGSFNSILSSLIVAHPKGAMALGNGFDPGQLDATHYNLYLELYPSGNPADRVVSMPAIDVTGNAGITPGQYTLESIVQSTNNKLREIGYNLRFIAFEHEGNFGIMLADAINCASFSIVKGDISSGTLATGTYTDNVIGESEGDLFDAFGFGATHADIAGSAYVSSFVDSTAAQSPTKVIRPLKRRNYIVDGVKRDHFAPTWMATEDVNGDGYWDGYISARTPVGVFSVETTYVVPLDLKAAGLKSGKTIVVQPAVSFADSTYFDVDYGRFIIKSVTFPPACPGETESTTITVINGRHAAGAGFGFSSDAPLPVKLYFSQDSVAFNNEHAIAETPTPDDYHRLHEVFIDNQLNTFSHERARLIEQGEGPGASPFFGDLLRTNEFHVVNVSPKLRGYRDSATDFEKYIRFFVLSYDTDTGEYTGQLGKRVGATVANEGPIITGRKNVVTRFYDETYVDYIDLIFVEDGVTSASSRNILSDGTSGGGGTPRYVDIQLFDSLQLNDDMLMLATAEAHWSPFVNSEEIVTRVVNRKQVGSVDEEDFTQSAIDFITAGDRHLHENGIIRGFNFDFVNTPTGEIFYKGGVALVNGKILTTNAISVTIPQVTENPNAADTLDWAVCVNEEGFLEPILITPTKQQFFALENTSASTYYLPSVTFAELVETRKDLVPIDVVTVDIASITVTNNADVRRFIDDGKGRDLGFSPTDIAGTFRTTDALKNWANNYNSSGPLHVKVRGSFDVDAALDFTGINNLVVLEGDGAEFNVTSDKGVLLESNVTLKNITFNYDPDLAALQASTFATNDIINIDNGCIFVADGLDCENIRIEDCYFHTTAIDTTTQRPPFIAFKRDNGDIINDLTIKRCRFSDLNAEVEVAAAIAILSVNSTPLGEPAVVYHCRIEDNVCDRFQGIWLTQQTDNNFGIHNDNGLVVVDTVVSGNNCGVIGFCTTSADSTASVITETDRTGGLRIFRNTAVSIGNYVTFGSAASQPGTEILEPDDMALGVVGGNVHISGNYTSAIWLVQLGITPGSGYWGTYIIDDNTVSATDYILLNKFSPSDPQYSAAYYPGILADSQDLDDTGEVQILNNRIMAGRFDSTNYTFTSGISVRCQCQIIGNTIRGLRNNVGIGIAAGTAGTGGDGVRSIAVISGNTIYRDHGLATEVNLARYIAIPGGINPNLSNEILVVDNAFDHHTLDGTNTEVINSAQGDRVTVARNKNHQQTIELSDCGWVSATAGIIVRNNVGTPSINSFIQVSESYQDDLLAGASNNPAVRFDYDSLDGVGLVNWTVNLATVVPLGAYIVDVEVDVSETISSTSTAFLRIENKAGTLFTQASNAIPPTASVATLAASDDAGNWGTGSRLNSVENRMRVEVECQAQTTSTVIRLSAIRVTYRI